MGARSPRPRPESNRILAETRRIAISILSGHPADLYLFGSWARGDAKRTSDIDLAIVPKGPIPPDVIVRLRSALVESHVPYRVDVVDLSSVAQGFRERVLEEGIRWTD